MLHLCPQGPWNISYPLIRYLASSPLSDLEFQIMVFSAGFNITQSYLNTRNNLHFVIGTLYCHHLITFRFSHPATKHDLRDSERRQRMTLSLFNLSLLNPFSHSQSPKPSSTINFFFPLENFQDLEFHVFAGNKFRLGAVLFSFYSGRSFLPSRDPVIGRSSL